MIISLLIIGASVINIGVRDKQGDNMSVAENIKKERRRMDITQEDLSDASGVPLPTIASLEQGQVQGRDETLEKIAKVFGVTVKYLRFGEERRAVMTSKGIEASEREIQILKDGDRVIGVLLPQELANEEDAGKLVEYAEFLSYQKRKRE